MIFKPYGVFVALSVVAAVVWTYREAKKAGQDPEKIWGILPWVLAGGLVGARLYHVAHYWWYYSQDLGRIFWVWQGGLGIYGALGGGLLGYFLYWLPATFWAKTDGALGSALSAAAVARWVGKVRGWFSPGLISPRPLPYQEVLGSLGVVVRNLRKALSPASAWRESFLWLDLAAPGIALGQAVGRLGNVVNGELLPFAVYEMGWDLAVFLILVKYEVGSRKYEARGWAGRRFLAYLFLYAFGRFFLEFIRTDNVWRWGSWSVAQLLSLGLIIFAVLATLKNLLLKGKLSV